MLTVQDKLTGQDRALRTLLQRLQRGAYHFVTPTPATHARVVGRGDRNARDLRDVFGWSLPFQPELLDPELLHLLEEAGLVKADEEHRLRANIRVSSLGHNLYVHSAYPTETEDAVFFGPDSYRFADFISAELQGVDVTAVRRIVDIGTGAGVGAMTARSHCPNASVAATDINPTALRFATINAAFAGITLEPCLSSTLDPLTGAADIIVANPPYLIDDQARLYRDGGSLHGAQVGLEMTAQALPRLARGGRFLLYSASAIVGGEDRLRAHLYKLARSLNCAIRYRELDPDVFGEELSKPAYRDVDRIAVIGAVMSPLE